MLKRYQYFIFIICVAISFVALNISIAIFGSSLTSDISSDKQYSLSQQTKDWLSQQSKDLYIRLYVSSDISKNAQYNQYSQDIVRILEQYQNNYQGKLGIHTITVSPLSNAETEGRKVGIKIEEGRPVLGLVVSDDIGNFNVIPHLLPERQAHLERDLSRLISELGNKQKSSIGILSPSIDVISTEYGIDTRGDWPFVSALRQHYYVHHISDNQAFIPQDIKVLLVINPQNISTSSLYAIDQYIMRGGNVILFADPYSEAISATTEQNEIKSFLEKLGIFYNPTSIISSMDNAEDATDFSIHATLQKTAPQQLSSWPLKLSSAGSLLLSAEHQGSAQILHTTVGEYQKINLYNTITDNKSSKKQTISEPQNISVLLEGKFLSYFQGSLYSDSSDNPIFLASGIKPARIIIVADSDILSSHLWQSEQSIGTLASETIPLNGNFDFIEQAIDYLNNNQNILSITPKASSNKQAFIANYISQIINRKYSAQSQAINEQISKTEEQKQQIISQLKENLLLPSLTVTRQLENIERQRLDLLQKQTDIEAQIIKNQQIGIAIFVAINLLLPLILIFVLYAITNLISKRIARQAERITNA